MSELLKWVMTQDVQQSREALENARESERVKGRGAGLAWDVDLRSARLDKTEPPRSITSELGPRPRKETKQRDQWLNKAARIDQHQTAWPGPIKQTDYASPAHQERSEKLRKDLERSRQRERNRSQGHGR